MLGLGASVIARSLSGGNGAASGNGKRKSGASVPYGQGARIEKVFTIERSASDLYAYWRDLRNLPAIMSHLERVEVLDDGSSRGRGADSAIDCVGMEAHAHAIDALADKAKQTLKSTFDRAHVLRQAIYAVGKGGTVSVPGVYVGFIDKFPMGIVVSEGLTTKVITHVLPLESAAEGYELFATKNDGCEKVVLKPGTLERHDSRRS